MRVVNAGYEIVKIKDPVKKVERIARICYKSEDKIKEGSAEKMVRALIKSNHTAMIEHSSLVMEVSPEVYGVVEAIILLMKEQGKPSYMRVTGGDRLLISGNMRAWRECIEFAGNLISPSIGSILTSDKYVVFFENISIPQEPLADGWAKEIDPETLTGVEALVHRDLTVIFTVDRGVSHEIVRHRPASYAQESTRYCNYGKTGEVVFIKPCFWSYGSVEYSIWEKLCEDSEFMYHTLITVGAKPQEARSVLATSVKTEVAMTTNLMEWIHFFNLRALGTTGAPHPQMLEVAVPLLREVAGEIDEFKDLIPVAEV